MAARRGACVCACGWWWCACVVVGGGGRGGPRGGGGERVGWRASLHAMFLQNPVVFSGSQRSERSALAGLRRMLSGIWFHVTHFGPFLGRLMPRNGPFPQFLPRGPPAARGWGICNKSRCLRGDGYPPPDIYPSRPPCGLPGHFIACLNQNYRFARRECLRAVHDGRSAPAASPSPAPTFSPRHLNRATESVHAPRNRLRANAQGALFLHPSGTSESLSIFLRRLTQDGRRSCGHHWSSCSCGGVVSLGCPPPAMRTL